MESPYERGIGTNPLIRAVESSPQTNGGEGVVYSGRADTRPVRTKEHSTVETETRRQKVQVARTCELSPTKNDVAVDIVFLLVSGGLKDVLIIEWIRLIRTRSERALGRAETRRP